MSIQSRLVQFIKNKFPFSTDLYFRLRKAIQFFLSLLPSTIRSRMGIPLTVWNKKRIILKLYKQRKKLPSFAGKRVLLWEPAPWPMHIAFVACSGVPLSLKGCDVELVICDGTPVACIGREINDKFAFSDWKKRCPGCYKACKEEAESFVLKTQALGELINPETLSKLREISQSIDVDEITSFKYKEVDVGSYTLSSVIRYYQGKIAEFEENILREFLFSALVITEASNSKMDTFKPDVVHMSHGIYTLWGPALTRAQKKGIPVIKYSVAYKKQCMYYIKIKPSDTNLHFGILSDIEWKTRLKIPLSLSQKEKVMKYLEERYTSNSGRFKYLGFSLKTESKQNLFKRLSLTNDKPAWCVFTHLTWDASVNVTKMAYRDYSKWVIETMKIIKDVPDIQWLIKIHPAEKMFGTIDGIANVLGDNFGKLPPNIKIIHSDMDINTYDIMKNITGGITCHGTVGLELAAMGKPVILAANAYYGQKGFTYDGLDAEEYQKLLKKARSVPSTLTPEQQENAIKFAYICYIQKQLPLRMFKVDNNGNWIDFDWSKVESLIPGNDPVIDSICNGFFEGDDFILSEDVIDEISNIS